MKPGNYLRTLFFTIYGILFFIFNGQAQLSTGTRFKEGLNKGFDFESYHIKKDNATIRYDVKIDGEEIISIDFKIDFQEKKLTVTIHDQHESGHEVYFPVIDSLKFVNNYKIKDTNIHLYDRPEILFSATVVNSNFWVKLYKYHSQDDSFDYEFYKIADDAQELHSHIHGINEYYDSLRKVKIAMEVEDLRKKIDDFEGSMSKKASILIQQQQSKINDVREKGAEADTGENEVMENTVKNEIRNHFTYLLHNGQFPADAGVICVFDYVVDQSGKIMENNFKVDFEFTHNSEMIEAVVKSDVINTLKRKTFTPQFRTVSNPTLYQDFENGCLRKLAAIGLNYSGYKAYLRGKRSELQPYESSEVPVSVHYNFVLPIKLQDSAYKLIYTADGNLNYKTDKVSVSEIRKDQFILNYPKARPGVYQVKVARGILDNQTFLDSIYRVSIGHRYFSMFGLSYTSLLPAFGPNSGFAQPLYSGNSNGVNLFYIYHHFGVFIGTHYSDSLSSFTVPSENGTYLSGNEKYFEMGVYLAAFNYLYLKAGLGHESADFILVNNLLQTTGTLNSPVGPLLGLSLILPWLQIETGYNFVVNRYYLNFGFNIKLNR